MIQQLKTQFKLSVDAFRTTFGVSSMAALGMDILTLGIGVGLYMLELHRFITLLGALLAVWSAGGILYRLGGKE